MQSRTFKGPSDGVIVEVRLLEPAKGHDSLHLKSQAGPAGRITMPLGQGEEVAYRLTAPLDREPEAFDEVDVTDEADVGKDAPQGDPPGEGEPSSGSQVDAADD